MLHAAVTFLTLAILGGLTAGIMHLGRMHVPLWVGIVHGAFALTGVGALAWGVGIRQGWAGFGTISLIIFLVAAAGGLYMFIRPGKRRPIPKMLILGHGGAALIAYILLIVHSFA